MEEAGDPGHALEECVLSLAPSSLVFASQLPGGEQLCPSHTLCYDVLPLHGPDMGPRSCGLNLLKP